ncbi:hypothetical protein Dimus_027665, partial [Dionaea muscipula]
TNSHVIFATEPIEGGMPVMTFSHRTNGRFSEGEPKETRFFTKTDTRRSYYEQVSDGRIGEPSFLASRCESTGRGQKEP